ncbi:MAG: hypothetical protein LBS74_03645 [Oscillospiraceae bacterium]|jgi:hypothetical protein|nr:hypothetical protein [Oscillospiraceae bacterium]
MENKYSIPTKEYSIDRTTKVQREKIVREALGLSTLDAPEPSTETMQLVQEYVDGKTEISDILSQTIVRYSQPAL